MTNAAGEGCASCAGSRKAGGACRRLPALEPALSAAARESPFPVRGSVAARPYGEPLGKAFPSLCLPASLEKGRYFSRAGLCLCVPHPSLHPAAAVRLPQPSENGLFSKSCTRAQGCVLPGSPSSWGCGSEGDGSLFHGPGGNPSAWWARTAAEGCAGAGDTSRLG